MSNQRDLKLVFASLILILANACSPASPAVSATNVPSQTSGDIQPTNSLSATTDAGNGVSANVNAPGSVDACKLLTPTEIEASLGEKAVNSNTTPSVQASSILFTSCTYNLTNAANTIDGILSVDYWNAHTLATQYNGPVAYVQQLKDADVKNNVDIPNLGDRAVWLGTMGELFVAAKDTVIEFDFMAQDYMPKITADDLEMLKKLAATAITHIS